MCSVDDLDIFLLFTLKTAIKTNQKLCGLMYLSIIKYERGSLTDVIKKFKYNFVNVYLYIVFVLKFSIFYRSIFCNYVLIPLLYLVLPLYKIMKKTKMMEYLSDIIGIWESANHITLQTTCTSSFTCLCN